MSLLFPAHDFELRMAISIEDLKWQQLENEHARAYVASMTPRRLAKKDTLAHSSQ